MATPAPTTSGARWQTRPPGRWLALGLLGRRFDMTIGITAHERPRQTANAVPPRPNDLPRTSARATARPGACVGTASINAQPVDGKSVGIASHVIAPPYGARADAEA
jgi:hypothetical protein